MKYIAIIFILICFSAFGQNSTLIDSLKLRLKTSTLDQQHSILIDLSWEYSYSDIDSAEYYAVRALELGEERNIALEITRAKSMLAIVYDIKGEVEKAAETYLEVATFYESSGNKSELSRVYNNLGVLFFYNGDMDQSWKYYRKSITLDSILGDSIGVAASLINLAAISNKWEKLDKAHQYLKRGERIAEKSGDEWIIRSIYEGLANNYLYKGEYDSSLKYINKALPLFKKISDHHSTLTNLNGLTIAYIGLEDYGKAEAALLEAQKLAKVYDDINIRSKRNSTAARLYAVQNNFQKAYKYQKLYQADHDSITNQERLRITSDLEKKYQTEQKENEIVKLQIQQQQSQNQRNILLLISALVILGSVMLFILFRSKAKANAIISKSLSEKETLLKEIHHRVKNNLQVVSSLLSMQSRFITDESALGAVNEGQTRVESMALIHQKLYQENNLSGVNAKEYIEDLAEILKQSYATDTNVEFEYDVDELMIDVDTIIPIGLILNELICNSLKHAFPESEEGLIKVGLKEVDNELKLEISDNGIGSKSAPSEKSFGMVLIDSLAMKLKATLQINTQSGTSVMLNISKYKLV
ncbi:histidine kinase dimerization/phosphoacceptor domain -containing protein [Ekhidna sp.]|uniref:tetratricopeptide repeat-containing sensor histidine kinase n=1 Tax=Ekhidna sp. TaxID=2608089 RepID=UPI003296FA01